MHLTRYSADTFALSDDRYAHFLGKIASFAGRKLMQAAGKGISSLGTYAKRALSGAMTQTPSVLTAMMQRDEPDAEYMPENEQELEEYGEEFDMRLSDDGRELAFTHPLLALMTSKDIEDVATRMLPTIEDALAVAELEDDNSGDEGSYTFFDDGTRAFHFKKKLKKLKKIGKKLGSLAGKLAPLVSMVPGIGTVAGAALGAVGGMASGGGFKGAIKGALRNALPMGLGSALLPESTPSSSEREPIAQAIQQGVEGYQPEQDPEYQRQAQEFVSAYEPRVRYGDPVEQMQPYSEYDPFDEPPPPPPRPRSRYRRRPRPTRSYSESYLDEAATYVKGLIAHERVNPVKGLIR